MFVGASSVTNSEDGVSNRELSSPVKVPMALFGENAEYKLISIMVVVS